MALFLEELPWQSRKTFFGFMLHRWPGRELVGWVVTEELTGSAPFGEGWGTAR